MSYVNGRIYVDTSKTPNEGVGIYDVQRALSTSRHDVGELCTHDNINMWARYKPETPVTGLVTYGVQPITLQQRTLNGYSIRALQNQQYGNLSSLVSDLRNGNARNPFTYMKPTGGASSPYRLTDFENYWHGAPCPITFPYNPTDQLAVTNTGALQLYYYVSEQGSAYGLGLADLRLQNDSQDLSSYYFGILIYNANNYYAGTQSSPMGRGSAEGLDVTLTGVSQTPAKYTMIPFFATQPIANQSSSFVGSIYPMIFAKGEIQTASEVQYFAISVWVYVWSNDMGTVRLRYSVVNRTSASRNFNTGTSYQSYFTIGNPSLSGTYLRDSIEVVVPCAAGSDASGDIVLRTNLLSAQQDFIRNGDTNFYIQAAQFNGTYTKSGIIEIWEPE